MFGVQGDTKVEGIFDFNAAMGAVETKAGEEPKLETAPTETEVKEPESKPAPTENVHSNDDKKEDSKTEYSEIIEEKPSPKSEAPQNADLTDDRILEYFKSKGREVNSIDDLFKTQEPKIETKEVEVNPYEDLMDETDKAYFKFKKETNGSYQDFLSLNKDWGAVSDSELARARVRRETGLSLTDSEADSYIQDQLGIDLEDLEGAASIKFKSFANQERMRNQEEQKKFAIPKENKKPVEVGNKEEVVTLDSGQTMKKAEYEKLVDQRKEYLKNLKTSVDGITEIGMELKVDDNGEKRTLDFKFDLTDADRHSMLSSASEVNKYVQENYVDDQGRLDGAKLAKALFLGNQSNFDKIMNAMATQVYAAGIEDHVKAKNNTNYNPKPLEKANPSQEGYGDILGESRPTFGVIGNI